MINNKIKADLVARGKSREDAEKKIFKVLNEAPDQIFTLRDICNKNGRHNGSFWGAAYHLAAQGKIGLADRKYHVWSASVLATYPTRIRTVIWNKDLDIENVIIREQWIDLVPNPKQAPLFKKEDVSTLSDSDLDDLMRRVSKERFERMLISRFKGSDQGTCDPVIDALRSIGIADPVAYVHSDAKCTFVTMTSTKEMPIKITLKSEGREARTIHDIEHITLHGLPVVATLKSAFEEQG